MATARLVAYTATRLTFVCKRLAVRIRDQRPMLQNTSYRNAACKLQEGT